MADMTWSYIVLNNLLNMKDLKSSSDTRVLKKLCDKCLGQIRILESLGAKQWIILNNITEINIPLFDIKV